MMPFDAYKQYLSLKNHFTKEKYDYHKYCGKSRATVQSFYKRKDRFWFEKVSRQKTDQEVIEFFVSNFITCTDPSKLWIGEMIREGESRYTDWKKRTQSLTYLFKEETGSIFADNNFNGMFSLEGTSHPQILKEYLKDNISIETLVILDRILEFRKDWDKKLQDPVWVYRNVFSFPSMNNEEKSFHVAMMEKLLDKQKVLFARLSLSDDPEAKRMKDKIIESATMMGLPEGGDLNTVFNNMSKMLDIMKRQIDNGDLDK